MYMAPAESTDVLKPNDCAELISIGSDTEDSHPKKYTNQSVSSLRVETPN